MCQRNIRLYDKAASFCFFPHFSSLQSARRPLPDVMVTKYNKDQLICTAFINYLVLNHNSLHSQLSIYVVSLKQFVVFQGYFYIINRLGIAITIKIFSCAEFLWYDLSKLRKGSGEEICQVRKQQVLDMLDVNECRHSLVMIGVERHNTS